MKGPERKSGNTLTRRQLLKKAAGLVVGIGGIAFFPSLRPPGPWNSPTSSVEPPQAVPEKPKEYSQFAMFLFDGFQMSELEAMLPKIQAAINHYSEPRPVRNFIPLLRQRSEAKAKEDAEARYKKRYHDTRKWEPLVDQVLRNNNEIFNFQPYLLESYKKMLLAMIYVESEGLEEAVAAVTAEAKTQNLPDLAEGLLQIKPSVANRLQKLHPQLPRSINLRDENQNILFGAKLVQRLEYSLWHRSLIFAGYNLGEAALINGIKAFAKAAEKILANTDQERKYVDLTIDRDFETLGANGQGEPATRVYAQKHQLNWEKLVNLQPARDGMMRTKGVSITQGDIEAVDRYFAACVILYPEDFKYIVDDQTISNLQTKS